MAVATQKSPTPRWLAINGAGLNRKAWCHMARTTSKGMHTLPGQLELVMSDCQEAASLIEHEVMGGLDAIERAVAHIRRRAAGSHTHMARAYRRAENAKVEFEAVAA